jgi:hypothetical protein
MKVANQLYQARESIKQVIYEITGISDIIRGSSVASETATAQDLKNKWGTVRLREMQTLVADYARDLFRMSVDCGADHIPAEKWKDITQLDIPTAKEQAIAKQQLAYMQQQAQAAQSMPPMQGQPPAPPPAQPDPALLAAAQSPTIESLLEQIKSDMHRAFVVNIQTSSTIDLDTAQDKSDVAEFMQALSQLLPGLQGLGGMGPSGFEAAKAILLAVCQRYKFGLSIADVLEKLTAPPPPAPEGKAGPAAPPPPNPAEEQAKTVEAQGKIAVLQAQQSLELAKVETEKQLLAIKIEEARLSLEPQKRKLAMPAPMLKTPSPAGKPQ